VANRIAVNRTIAGVHFPVDSAAGAVIGMTLGTYLAQRCQVPAAPATATLPYDAYTFVGPSFPDSGGPMADGDFYWTLYYTVGTGQQAPAPYVTRTSGTSVRHNPLLNWLWGKALAEWT
jgi:hypothetical protein